MATIKLEIVSPDRVVYAADIDMLIARSTGGEIGILPKHMPLVTGLQPQRRAPSIDCRVSWPPPSFGCRHRQWSGSGRCDLPQHPS